MMELCAGYRPFLVPSSDGSISLYPFEATDAIVDINGYFTRQRFQRTVLFPSDAVPRQQQHGRLLHRQLRAADLPGHHYSHDPYRVIAAMEWQSGDGEGLCLNALVIPNGNVDPVSHCIRNGSAAAECIGDQCVRRANGEQRVHRTWGTNGSVDVYAFRRPHVVVEIS